MNENVSYLCKERSLKSALVIIMCKMRKQRKYAVLLGVNLQSQGLESMKINTAALMLGVLFFFLSSNNKILQAVDVPVFKLASVTFQLRMLIHIFR